MSPTTDDVPAGSGVRAGNERLVNAPAGKRLGALAVDTAVVALVWAVVMIALALRPDAGSAPSPAVGVGAGSTVLVLVLQWWGEATRGRSLGSSVVGLRTVGARGAAPGWRRALIRGLLVLLSWFVPVIGPGVLVLSCLLDRDRRRQGWHDKAAGTWVVDTSRGSDPFVTRVGPNAATTPTAAASEAGTGTVSSAAPDTDPIVVRQLRTAARGLGEDDGPEGSRPVAPWRLTVDDGSTYTLTGRALIGRDPRVADHERDVLLVTVLDPRRSVSKTHAHLEARSDGVWVTDRGSTNGTAVTPPTGARMPVETEAPLLAGDGAVVHVGDRTITVTR